MSTRTGACAVAAGGSSAVQAVQSLLGGFWASKQQDRSARRAGRYAAGCRGERAVCAELSTLAVDGFHHVDDRRWRADDTALVNLDHLVVGPTGVFVLDTKNWAGQIEVRGGQLLQDGIPRDERLVALTWLSHRVEEVLLAEGHGLRPRAVVCFASPTVPLPDLHAGMLLCDLPGLRERLTAEPVVLSPDQVQAIVDLLTYAFPAYDVDPREAAEAEGLLFPDEQTRHAGLRAALERPVEEWMVWLHPEQASSARRVFSGPARIRGAAGTGKTAVALHRVAWLAASRPGRFLVTSYVKTLPPLMADSYARLSPRTADRVDFRHVHGVALDVLRERGVRVQPDTGRTAFTTAYQHHRQALEQTGLRERYFEEEVQVVLKGRALTDLDSYLRLDRVGRRVPLRADLRREVWALAQRYDAELAARGQCDMVDVLRLARDAVRELPYRRWTGVVVDEVQDLPLVGLQLLHELAGRDRPDGLLLVGDGQQAIYPGGFRLLEAGISVAGRAVVLRSNYRNTVEILASARAVVAQDEYDDLDVVPEKGERPVEVVRHGEIPSAGRYPTLSDHDAALLWDLHALVDRGTRLSDIALLCPTNALAERYASLLSAQGLRCTLLARPHAAADGIRVGTWARAKGMEFPHVFLPQVDRRTRLLTAAGVQAQDEKAELLRRTLYVAMTRARDTLWTGRVGPN